jgi:mono/diheme cytochrome c family protein
MTRMTWVLASMSVVGILAPTPAVAQQTTEAFSSGTDGSSIYRTYCAVCHGREAKGDGPLAENLRQAPPDLTLLAKRNAGKFDADAVHRMIDGRNPIKGHGGPDMPIWGDAFKRSSDGYSEKAVKARIDALVEHLRSLQRQ